MEKCIGEVGDHTANSRDILHVAVAHQIKWEFGPEAEIYHDRVRFSLDNPYGLQGKPYAH